MNTHKALTHLFDTCYLGLWPFLYTALFSHIQLPINITQFTSSQPFFDFVYPPDLLKQTHTNLYTFYGRAILTVCNDIIAVINDTILCSLFGLKSIFYFTNTAKQNNDIENTPPLKFL